MWCYVSGLECVGPVGAGARGQCGECGSVHPLPLVMEPHYTEVRGGEWPETELWLLLLKSKWSISDESFVCLDYVDLGFDDIMREESAGPTLAEDRHPMSEAGPGQALETEEACRGEGEGDIISDIERIQRALSGNETGWRYWQTLKMLLIMLLYLLGLSSIETEAEFRQLFARLWTLIMAHWNVW